jgi:hypothetical protein
VHLLDTVVLGSRAPPHAAATPPEVALSLSPPLCGDRQPEGTTTGCGAELVVKQVAAPPACELGGRVL